MRISDATQRDKIIAIAEINGWTCNNPLCDNYRELSFCRATHEEPLLEEVGVTNFVAMFNSYDAIMPVIQCQTSGIRTRVWERWELLGIDAQPAHLANFLLIETGHFCEK